MSGPRSRAEEVEELNVDVVAVAGLEAGTGAAVTDDPEGTLELPQGVAPAELAEQRDDVAEPDQGVAVGGVVVAAELADVDRPADGLDVTPRPVGPGDGGAVPGLAFVAGG